MMLRNVTGIVGRISEQPVNQLVNQVVTENAHKHKAQLEHINLEVTSGIAII